MLNTPAINNKTPRDYVLESKDGYNCIIPDADSTIAAIVIGESYESRSLSRTAASNKPSRHPNYEPVLNTVEYPLIEIFGKHNSSIFEKCGEIAERDFMNICQAHGFDIWPATLRTLNTERLELRNAVRVRPPLSENREEFFKPEDIEFLADLLEEFQIINVNDKHTLLGTFSTYLISQCAERIILAYDSSYRLLTVKNSIKDSKGQSDQVMDDFNLGAPTQFYKDQTTQRHPFATFRGQHQNLNGEDLHKAFKTLSEFGDLHMLDDAQSNALRAFSQPLNNGSVPPTIHLSAIAYANRFKRQFGEWMQRFFSEV